MLPIKIFSSEESTVEVKRNVLLLWANLAEKYPGAGAFHGGCFCPDPAARQCCSLLAQSGVSGLLTYAHTQTGFICEALMLPGVLSGVLDLLQKDEHPILTLHALLAMEMFCRTGEQPPARRP